MLRTLNERLDALSGGRNRVSVAYERAAWLTLVAAVVLWQGFAAAALGFYLGSMVLRREGL